MYKYLSIVLAGLLVVVGAFYFFERRAHSKDVAELSNQVSELQGVVQETKTAYSRQAVQLEDLKVQNSDLQRVIKEKDETIFAVSQVALKLKDKAFEDKNVHVTVLDPDGNPTTVPQSCDDCLKSVRLKVDFDQGDDLVKISGYTLTNPGYASINVKWLRPLKMNIALTKKEGNYKIYVDAGGDGVPADLDLRVDPTVFQKKWYEKIGVGLNVGVGRGVLTGVRAFYDIFDNIAVGPGVDFYYDGSKLNTLYGANVGWYPFR